VLINKPLIGLRGGVIWDGMGVSGVWCGWGGNIIKVIKEEGVGARWARLSVGDWKEFEG